MQGFLPGTRAIRSSGSLFVWFVVRLVRRSSGSSFVWFVVRLVRSTRHGRKFFSGSVDPGSVDPPRPKKNLGAIAPKKILNLFSGSVDPGSVDPDEQRTRRTTNQTNPSPPRRIVPKILCSIRIRSRIPNRCRIQRRIRHRIWHQIWRQIRADEPIT